MTIFRHASAAHARRQFVNWERVGSSRWLGRTPASWLAILVLLTMGAASIAIYAPFEREPFDVLDFSEFLLVLQRTHGFWDGLVKLAIYYGTQGRVIEMMYAIISANWQLFGLDPLGWQAVRATQLLGLLPVSYLGLRSFGTSRYAALVGASLYAFGTVPAASWIRQTAEPISTLAMLLATMLLRGWSDGRQSLPKVLLLFVLLLAMLFSKETMIASIPFLACLATTWTRQNRIVRPRFGIPFVQFTLVSIAACGILALALAWSSCIRQPDSYAALYGTAPIGSGVVLFRVAQTLLPISYNIDLLRLLLFPSNFVFVIVCLVLAVRAWRSGWRRHALPRLAMASVIPVLGLAVYLPWPRYEAFYSLPYLFGVALMFAMLVDEGAPGPRARTILGISWIVVLGGAAINAHALARYTRSQRELNFAVAQRLALSKADDTVVVATNRLTPQVWQNPAATFRRYVQALHLTETPATMLDLECDVGTRASNIGVSNDLAIVFLGECPSVQPSTDVIERRFQYFDWASAGFRQAAVKVAVFHP